MAPQRSSRPGKAGALLGLTIRPGTPRDAATITALIHGLADYERLPHETTTGAIRRHGFGRRRRHFETLICRLGRRPIGLALYTFTYSTFLARPTLWLEDLFVLPEARGRGAGLALLRALARIAVRRGCGRMEWTVLDWNRPAIRFYRSLEAELKREWILTRLTGEPLARLAGVSRRAESGRARPSSRPRTPTAGAGRRRPPRRAPAAARRRGRTTRRRQRA
jgi:GNAT superfamily N-acetyltransferase